MRRCEAAVRGGARWCQGGLAASWPAEAAPPAAASASARAAPRTRGTGGNREGRGSARLGRLARSRGRGRLCGCHPLAGI